MDTQQAAQGRWMSVIEVAEVLEISDWTVRKMIDRGELPAKRFGKKPIIKIDRQQFEEWLASQ